MNEKSIAAIQNGTHLHRQQKGTRTMFAQATFAQPTEKQRKCLVPAAIVMTLAGVLIAPMAFARITTNTIDTLAIVTDHDRHLIVTGPIG